MVRAPKSCSHAEGHEIYALFRAASVCWFRALHDSPTPARYLLLSELRVLLDLLRQAPKTASVSKLASGIDRSTAWTSRVTTSLTQMGYVHGVRDAKDRRVVSVSLTQRGAELATALRENFSVSVAAALSDVSPEERSAIQHFLEHFSAISASRIGLATNPKSFDPTRYFIQKGQRRNSAKSNGAERAAIGD